MKHTAILLTTLGLLLLGSLQAQTVPPYISYQGNVTDSNGDGLGTGTPVNRKIIFRIYDAATAGTKLWTEEQTVSISGGEFSVLLGLGIPGTGSAAGENRPAIDTVFTSAGIDRYMGLTVDNGDGTINAGDAEIAPRQRITSTAYSFRARSADTIASGTDLQLNNSADYGLGYYGAGAPTGHTVFGGITVNGPVLYGQSGGALGSSSGATKNIALKWDDNSNVTLSGTISGNGSGLTNLDATKITGTLADARLSGNVALRSGGNRVFAEMAIWSDFEAGGNLELRQEVASWGTQTKFNDYRYLSTSFAGIVEDGNFKAFNVGPGGVGIGYNPPLYGANNALLVNGNVGIGTATPQQKLHVAGGVLVTGGVELLGGATIPNLEVRNPGGPALIDFSIDEASDYTARIITNGPGRLDHQVGYSAFFGGVAVIGGFEAFTTSSFAGLLSANGGLTTNKIGIGTSNPSAPLHVNGSASLNYNLEWNANNGGSADVQNVPVTNQLVSIIASNIIRTGTAFHVESDARVKSILAKSDSAADLSTLLRIEVTDYTMKDVAMLGNAPQKKVIAQQLEQVFPQAVSKGSGVVPDQLQRAIFKDGWIELATDLKVGDRVRLILEAGEGIHEVLAVRDGAFRTDLKTDATKVFVYGREVKDFRTVDYDAISMLNVSATQQIKKEKDAEVKALKNENASLRAQLAAQQKLLVAQTARLTTLEASDKARDAKLAAIEKLLLSADKPTARTVSLQTGNGAE